MRTGSSVGARWLGRRRSSKTPSTWLAIEPDRDRRRKVIEFLMQLCAQEGRVEDARPVPGTQLPAFAAMVPETGVVIVWVIAESYENLAIRYLYDVAREIRFGG